MRTRVDESLIQEPEPEQPPAPVANPRARPLPPLDDDGYRKCARPECSANFKPSQLSRAFCSDECAILAFGKRHGLTFAKAEAVAESKAKDPERDALVTAKHGPMREVVEVLHEGERSKAVRFTCGHEQTILLTAKRMRCRACRDGKASVEVGGTLA